MTDPHQFTCSDCSYPYQVSDEQYYDRDRKIVCPKCHSKYKMQTIELSDNMGLNMRDTFSISSTDVRTNRTTLDESDETPTNRIMIEDFIHTTQ